MQRGVYFNYTCCTLLAVPMYNIVISLWPLFRIKDDISDIPLTPGQRKLLGCRQHPHCQLPVPRIAHRPDTGATRRSFLSSPILDRSPLNQGSPTLAGNGSSVTLPSYQLLQRLMFGARCSLIGLLSPLGVGIQSGASVFGKGPESPSPSPAGSEVPRD